MSKAKIPTLCKHPNKSVGYTRYYVNGKRKAKSFGPFSDPDCERRFKRWLIEYLREINATPSEIASHEVTGDEFTLNDLLDRYAFDTKMAKGELPYRDKMLLKAIFRHPQYLTMPCPNFGPRAFRQLLLLWANERSIVTPTTDKSPAHAKPRYSQWTVNYMGRRLRSIFQFGVAQELFHPDVHARLTAAKLISAGESIARETQSRKSIPFRHLRVLMRELPQRCRDILVVTYRGTLRTGETLTMTWDQIDTSRQIWVYTPDEHKRSHKGESLEKKLGIKAQRVLMRYRNTKANEPIFASTGSNPKYRVATFLRTMHRVCDRMGIPRYLPSEIRHTRYGAIKKKHGPAKAGAAMGHKSLDTGSWYDHVRGQEAEEVAKASG